MSTHYETLGVEQSATAADIKKAFRAKVKAHHPDTNDSTDDEYMKSINAAYDVLKDQEKRNAYDDELRYQASGQTRYDPHSSPWMHARRSGMGDQQQNNVRGNVGIPIDVIMNGGTVKVPIQVPVMTNSFRNMMQFNIRNEIVSVTIEPKCPIGSTIILTKADHKLTDVDLVILTMYPEENPNADYRISGHDIYVPIVVDVFAAMLGEDIVVQLPTGSSGVVTLPTNFTAGKTLRLLGRGLPKQNGSFGDVLLVISLKIPPIEPEMLDKIKAIVRPTKT